MAQIHSLRLRTLAIILLKQTSPTTDHFIKPVAQTFVDNFQVVRLR